jgi:hypothetical protein
MRSPAIISTGFEGRTCGTVPNSRDRAESDALEAEAERTPSLAEGQALKQRAEALRREGGPEASKAKAVRFPIFRN